MALPKNPHYRRWIALLAITALLLASIALWRMPELNALEWYVESGKPAMTPGPISLAKPLQWSDDYYTVADLGHGDFAIGEPKYGQCNFAYLITPAPSALSFSTLDQACMTSAPSRKSSPPGPSPRYRRIYTSTT